MKNTPKLFYVVDPKIRNREIFETLEEAEDFAKLLREPYQIHIADVRNWYFEEDLKMFKYEDKVDTFTIRVTIIHKN